jgi:hypothetical protein
VATGFEPAIPVDNRRVVRLASDFYEVFKYHRPLDM